MVIVPDRPSVLGIEIPGDAWRPRQRETIQAIVDAFDSGKRFVLANMPTGAGKTLVATAVQRLMDWSAVNLTHTINLQKQYAETMPWATVVTGRRNHPCLLVNDIPGLDPTLCADFAPCAHGDDCNYISSNGCSYYRMLFAAANERHVITNYAYATRILQAPRLKGMLKNPFRRELLVCDEGDLAEDAIVDAARIHMVSKTWGPLGAPIWSKDINDWVEWAGLLKPKLEPRLRKLSVVSLNELSSEEVKDRNRLRWQVRTLESIVAINEERYDEWIVVTEEGAVNLRPLWGWTVARNLLWGYFPRVLLMSATLGDPNVLMRKLGIPAEEADYIDVPSIFSPANRPVFYWPLMPVSRKTDDEDWDRLAKALEYLADQPGLRDKKGVIHTGSFAVAGQIARRLNGRRFMSHGRAGNKGTDLTLEQALMVFEHATDPLVILSPSMTHGVDLPYVIGWQAIVKVPFADLGDPVVRARREYKEAGDGFGRRCYDADALNRVIQATGRAVRTPDDRGISYIMDQHFWPLYKRAYSPQSFRDALRWLKR